MAERNRRFERADLRGLFPDEISDLLAASGLQPFRGVQVFRWVQGKAVQDWRQLANVGEKTREILQEKTFFQPLKLKKESISRDGTRKFLWELADGRMVESVLLYHTGEVTKTRHTLCLSTQVGCPMGCDFCATGQKGLERNLTAGEIVGQVLDAQAHMRQEQEGFKIKNVVYMGMGEPLLNLPAVVKSVKILNHRDGQNIGMRRITISTCGLVPQIEQLAAENLDVVLAVSLHAANNRLRDDLMPVNRQYPLETLMAACRRYVEKTGRRLTFEYALIKNVNDGPEDARQLAILLKGIKANVNVIPVNAVSEGKYLSPSAREVRKFVAVLNRLGLAAVAREEKGGDIEAACGQLAAKAR